MKIIKEIYICANGDESVGIFPEMIVLKEKDGFLIEEDEIENFRKSLKEAFSLLLDDGRLTVQFDIDPSEESYHGI